MHQKLHLFRSLFSDFFLGVRGLLHGGGGQQEGRQGSHTPVDPKGSADRAHRAPWDPIGPMGPYRALRDRALF